MAKLVTIKTVKRAKQIEESGVIKACLATILLPTEELGARGKIQTIPIVYAMPVSTNYVISHQWIAEISRCYRHQPVSAVYFELPDEYPVYFGHFAGVKTKATAVEACGYFYQKIHSEDINTLIGFEVLIPCDFLGNIKKVKHHLKRTGWRLDPRIMVTDAEQYRRAYQTDKEYLDYIKLKYD